MRITRRDVTRGLAGLGLSAGTGLPAIAAAEPTAADLARRLQADLSSRIRPGCTDTTLTVTGLDLAQTASGVRRAFRIDARVRLDWPPGMRQRPFLFYGPEVESAYAGLRDRVVAEFARAHPGCIA